MSSRGDSTTTRSTYSEATGYEEFAGHVERELAQIDALVGHTSSMTESSAGGTSKTRPEHSLNGVFRDQRSCPCWRSSSRYGGPAAFRYYGLQSLRSR